MDLYSKPKIGKGKDPRPRNRIPKRQIMASDDGSLFGTVANPSISSHDSSESNMSSLTLEERVVTLTKEVAELKAADLKKDKKLKKLEKELADMRRVFQNLTSNMAKALQGENVSLTRGYTNQTRTHTEDEEELVKSTSAPSSASDSDPSSSESGTQRSNTPTSSIPASAGLLQQEQR